MPSSNRSFSRRRPDLRSLHADEAYVLDAYQDHANYCSWCAEPLESADLCSVGTQLAEKVVKYLSQRGGQFYARRSHPGDKTDKVRLPTLAYSVKRLLAAVEQGYHLKTTGEKDPGTAAQDYSSIHIIEPRPRQSTPTYHFQIRPFCSRRNHLYVLRPIYPRFSCVSSLGLKVGVRCKSRKSTVEVELRYSPGL